MDPGFSEWGGGVGMDVAAGRVPLNLLPCVLKGCA